MCAQIVMNSVHLSFGWFEVGQFRRNVIFRANAKVLHIFHHLWPLVIMGKFKVQTVSANIFDFLNRIGVHFLLIGVFVQ